jgi:hypothetical protein
MKIPTDIFKAFHFHDFEFVDESIILAVCIGLVTVLAINVFYVGYSWVIQSFRQLWTVRLLRATASLMCGPLFIPILSVYAEAITCPELDGVLCTTLQPIIALLTLFFVPFALANTATFYDAEPMSTNPTAMPHSRVSLAHQVVRTVLAILSSLLPRFVADNSASKLIILHFWAALMTTTSLAILVGYVWLQPYYSHRFNVLTALLMAGVFWTSFCMALSGKGSQHVIGCHKRHMHTHAYTRIQTQTHADTRRHTYTRIRTNSHACTHTHTGLSTHPAASNRRNHRRLRRAQQ